MADVLYIGSDRRLWMLGLAVDGVYQTAATLTYTLTDSAGTVKTTGTLTYVAGSVTVTTDEGTSVTSAGGNYKATIESTVTSGLTAGDPYYLYQVTADGSYDDERRLELYAQWRGRT